MTPTTARTAAAGDVANLGVEQRRSTSLMRSALRRLRRDYLTLVALGVLLALSLLSLLAPMITEALDVSYTLPNSASRFLPIGSEGHPLGTDHLGRDVLARLLYGGRVSLSIGVTAAVFCTLIGVSVGLVAGYYRGGPLSFVDDVIMWFITTLNSIPLLVLLILIASVLTPSIPTLILVLTLVSWSDTMRLIRGETISQRKNEYVISAQAIGARPLRIMFAHILPNTLSVLITAMAIQIGTLILIESALSFLGLGVRPPEPSWGNMLTGAQAHFRQGAHLSILPGLMIVITVLSLFLVGDGLRDAFDPSSRK
jgi:peptide/nickel transport system permease protein